MGPIPGRGHPVAPEDGEAVEDGARGERAGGGGGRGGSAGAVGIGRAESCWGRPAMAPDWALWEERHATAMEKFAREASSSGRDYGNGGACGSGGCLPCGGGGAGAWRGELGGGGLVFAPVPSGPGVEGAEALPRVLFCGPPGGGKTRLLEAAVAAGPGVGSVPPGATREFVLRQLRVPVPPGFVPLAASSGMPRQTYAAFDHEAPGVGVGVGGGEVRVQAVEAGGCLGAREWAKAMLSGPADAVCFVVRGSWDSAELAEAGVALREFLRWCRPTLRRNRVPVLVVATNIDSGEAAACSSGEQLVAGLQLDFKVTRHSPLACRVVDIAEEEALRSCMRWLLANAGRGGPDGSHTFGRRDLLSFDDGGLDEVAAHVPGYIDTDANHARLRAEVDRDRARMANRASEVTEVVGMTSVPPSPSKVDVIMARNGGEGGGELDDIGEESDNEVYDITPRQSPAHTSEPVL